MKYCFNCNHITPGEPLFCERCGRTYDLKLCPRMHPNPRSADVCSRCGSRDFSTPQPRVPWWAPIVQFLLSSLSGAFLTIVSVIFALGAIAVIIQRPDMVVALALLYIPFAILWWAWSQIPSWFRTRIYKLLKHKRDAGGGARS